MRFVVAVLGCLGFMMTIGLLVLATGAKGEFIEPDPVEVHFEYGNNETQMAYVGQNGIGLMVAFHENSTDWEVETDSDLFEDNIFGMTRETMEAGSGICFGLDLDPAALPGTYVVPVWVRYTDDDATPKEFRFDLQLEYVKAWRMVDFRIASGNVLVLRIETYERFDAIKCEFDTDGSLLADPEWHNMTDVTPGTYTFKAQLSKDRDAPRWDEDEVGYDVRGWVNGTCLQFWEKNIDPGTVRTSGAAAFFASGAGMATVAIVAGGIACVSGFLLVHRRSARPPKDT